MRRKLALKLVKPAMDTRVIVARFDTERVALAIMDHVNIARVYDGGHSPHLRGRLAMWEARQGGDLPGGGSPGARV